MIALSNQADKIGKRQDDQSRAGESNSPKSINLDLTKFSGSEFWQESNKPDQPESFQLRHSKEVCEFKIISKSPHLREGVAEIQGPDDVLRFLKTYVEASLLFNPDKECLVVVYLNDQKMATGFEIAAIGSDTMVICDSRSVFRGAILANAHSIIIAHNHPSGLLLPSENDFLISDNMKEIGKIVGIGVLDCVIWGGSDVSIRSIFGYMPVRIFGHGQYKLTSMNSNRALGSPVKSYSNLEDGDEMEIRASSVKLQLPGLAGLKPWEESTLLEFLAESLSSMKDTFQEHVMPLLCDPWRSAAFGEALLLASDVTPRIRANDSSRLFRFRSIPGLVQKQQFTAAECLHHLCKALYGVYEYVEDGILHNEKLSHLEKLTTSQMMAIAEAYLHVIGEETDLVDHVGDEKNPTFIQKNVARLNAHVLAGFKLDE